MDPKHDTSTGLMTRLQAWAAHPFTANMDMLSVVLTTGLVIIAAFFWTRVLNALD